MKDYARAFYFSQAWIHTRKAYAKSKGNLCERCLEKGLIVPGEIVHHKVHINEQNIGNVNITLNWENLQLVCRKCHAEIHIGHEKRYKLDEHGRLITTDTPQGKP